MNNIKKILTDAEWAEYQALKAKSQESKPPANADMDEFGEWLRILSEKASYSDQREPVKAPADEGLVSREEVLKILRATMCEMACKDDMITAVYNLPRGHNASDKGVK